jgi:hypothetical protein
VISGFFFVCVYIFLDFLKSPNKTFSFISRKIQFQDHDSNRKQVSDLALTNRSVIVHSTWNQFAFRVISTKINYCAETTCIVADSFGEKN